MQSAPILSKMSVEGFERQIATVAQWLSIQRKLDDPSCFNGWLSTDAEMLRDWRQGCVFWAARFLMGELLIGRFDQSCYVIFEELWLEEVKRYSAYCRWLYERGP